MKWKIVLAFSLVFLIGFGSVAYAAEPFQKSNLNADNANEIEDIIKDYYTASYDMWWNLEMGDLSPYLDMEAIQCYNKTITLKSSIMRWKYKIEKGYYKGQRERHEIYYDFQSIDISGNEAEVRVDLSGETYGMPAYPFFISFGENTFKLKKINDTWKIYAHDYDDVCFYEQSKTERLIYGPVSLKQRIDEDYSNTSPDILTKESEFSLRSYPHTDYSYSSSRAVTYANQFVSSRNTYFYNCGDGSRDCTNFVSQCVSYGLGSTAGYSTSTSYRMVPGAGYMDGWYAGSGGGCGHWEDVEHHWNYMTSDKTNQNGPRVATTTWASLRNGGVMQIDWTSNGSYDHSVICVNKSSEKFAQHSENGYRYYDDYDDGTTLRFYRPRYFREYE